VVQLRHLVGEFVLWPVSCYCKYCVSYRDLEEMMEERSVDLDYTTLYRWRNTVLLKTAKCRRRPSLVCPYLFFGHGHVAALHFCVDAAQARSLLTGTIP